jgi:ATP-binding cassette subfamily B (MDR/TAP) protein 6
MNFETVKYFGNENWEVSEYDKAINLYQKSELKSTSSLYLLNTIQNLIITSGLLCGIILSAKRVLEHSLTVGDFVSFVTYLLQLYQPLNYFGTYYRAIQTNLVDMEQMLELFDLENISIDSPEAVTLETCEGTISFENVTFSYTGSTTPTLKNINFKVESGTSCALVGKLILIQDLPALENQQF